MTIKSIVLLGSSIFGTLVHGAPSIETIQINPVFQVNTFTLEANVEAVNEATISAQTSGRVKSIPFDVNDYVQQGDIVIQLRDKQQKSALEQAQAGLIQAQAANSDAQSKLEQSTSLFDQGSLSKGQFDTIKANAKSAAAMVKASNALLEQAKENYSYTQIRAPYSGIVKARLIEVGESVSPGTPLMTGLSLSNLRVIADVPQRFTPHILDKTSFRVISADRTITPKKVTFFPYADPNSHTFKVRADIDGEGSQLFPGMWVKLQIPIGKNKKIIVPSSALVQKSELTSVYVKTTNGFKLRQVRAGLKQSNSIEILSGLRPGDVVAKHGIEAMKTMESKK